MHTHRQVFYTGRVQGVGFRYSVKQIAASYEVIGWVRNLPDGRVELAASGDQAEVEAFIAAIAGSHLAPHIKEAAVREAEPPARPAQGFEIRH
jgi:acylphosphatase